VGLAAPGGAERRSSAAIAEALFIISMVPLNFAPACSLRLKPHFWQLLSASELRAPQLGQNTDNSP
jgi:peroxiredoxin